MKSRELKTALARKSQQQDQRDRMNAFSAGNIGRRTLVLREGPFSGLLGPL
jgi:hypothetical protein